MQHFLPDKPHDLYISYYFQPGFLRNKAHRYTAPCSLDNIANYNRFGREAKDWRKFSPCASWHQHGRGIATQLLALGYRKRTHNCHFQSQKLSYLLHTNSPEPATPGTVSFKLCSACETEQKKLGNVGAEHISKHVVTALEEGTGDRAHTSGRHLFQQHNYVKSLTAWGEAAQSISYLHEHKLHAADRGDGKGITKKRALPGPTTTRRKAASLIICSHFNLYV